MDFARNDYLSMDALRATVSRMMGDKDMKLIEPGRYRSFIQEALTELSFDTYFNKKRFDFPVPQDLRLELPAGTFSVAEVYAYNGNECNVYNAQKLWYKENYFTKGNGFFAKNRGDVGVIDPFYPSGGELVPSQQNPELLVRQDTNIATNLLYYAVENGILMVSSSTRAYQNLHIVSHGSICPIGEVPLIPPLFRAAVEDFACETASRELIHEDRQLYMGLNAKYTQRLGLNEYSGSWPTAKKRAKNMSKGQRNDWAEYYGRWSW